MSREVKKILCCIALSRSSEHVLERALLEAEAHDATVSVLHIIPSFDAAMTTPIVSFMGEERFRALVEEHKEEVASRIRDEIERIKGRLREKDLEGAVDRITDVEIYEGDPELEILNMCGVMKADMLVLGTHTKGITSYTFTGSVARKVIRRALVPVLLVPPVTR